MPVITVRVDSETRDAMRRVHGVNWSEVLRQRIRDVVKERTRSNKVKALLANQELYRKAPKGYDSTKVIRKWRDTRYGPRRGRR